MSIRNNTSLFSVLHGLVYPLPSMAAHLPCLPGSLHISLLILTSFVPPAYNQGVSLAPCQGLALWKLFLPTTGSFFVNITFTDRLPVTALFPEDVPLPRSVFSSASQQFFQSSVFPAWLRATDSSLCICMDISLLTPTAWALRIKCIPSFF